MVAASAAQAVQANSGESGSQERGAMGTAIDSLQVALDIAGTIEPTPFADLANAGLSIGRAFLEPHRAGEHLKNAAISGLGVIPYVGDLAKVGKYGSKASSATAKIGGQGGKQGGFVSWLMGNGAAVGGNIAATAIGGMGGGGGGSPPVPPSAGPGGAAGGGPNNAGNNQAAIAQAMQQATTALQTFGQALQNSLPTILKIAGVGLAIGVIIGAIRRAMDRFNKVDQQSRNMLGNNQGLAQYSGEKSLAYMQLDVERVQRDINRAGRMSGSIGRLARAQSEYEEARENLITPFSMFFTEWQAVKTKVATFGIKLLDNIEPLSELLEQWLDKDGNDKDARNAIEKSMQMRQNEAVRDRLGPENKP